MKKILLILTISLCLFSCTQKTEKTCGTVTHINEIEFQEKIFDFKENPQQWKFKSDTPCIVDIYATWCRPCKMMSPALDSIAKVYGDDLHVYKIDIDKLDHSQNINLINIFQISAVPTLLFCSQKEVYKMQGALPYEYLQKEAEKLINQ